MTATVIPVRKTYKEREEREALKFTRQEIADWLGISRDTLWVYENLIARKAIKDFKDEAKPRRKMSLYCRWVLREAKFAVEDQGTHEDARKHLFKHRNNYTKETFEQLEDEEIWTNKRSHKNSIPTSGKSKTGCWTVISTPA
jgi:hypothetical protein